MYILIKRSLCPELKNEIGEMIDNKIISTWEFIHEEGKRRLKHTSKERQYNDVVLRFLNSYIEGVSYIKIIPTVVLGKEENETTEAHCAIVLSRFAELLNCHFSKIGAYETVIG
jgi:hypothetical protein